MAEQQTPSSKKKMGRKSCHLIHLDPAALECPICCENMKIPIFQCKNGHIACSSCHKKVKRICPSCRSRNEFSRCRAMETVIEACRVSCPNSIYGCKANTSFENRSSHEKQCLFAPCSCPVTLNDCNYVGSARNLHKHVRAKHKDQVTRIGWDTPLTVNMRPGENITIFQEKKDKELFVVQAFRRSDGLAVSVNCIAQLALGVGRFSCSLNLVVDCNTKLKMAFMVRDIQKLSHEEPKDGFMFIPSHILLPTDWKFDIEFCFSRGVDGTIRL